MAKFKLFAGTETGLRDNNEDNFTVCPDLSKGEWVIPSDQQTVISLGQSGCLMVVADGMGGQNAGEVASAIAISTVQEMFAPPNLSESIISKPESARDFMRKVIIEADRKVKEHSSAHSDTEGMGSTIVMVWLLGSNAHVAWMGDSRAYSFLPKEGLKRLSKDHSYVQKLVDAGQLTEQQAMEHPDSNIITRSLGDTSQNAKPDAITHVVQSGEVILLCSDGLCGFCNDEQICGIIIQNQHDLPTCKEVLTEAALNADSSDNITIALLQVIQTDTKEETTKKDEENGGVVINILLTVIAAFVFLSLCYAGYNLFFSKTDALPMVVDSIAHKDGVEENSPKKKEQQQTTKKDTEIKENKQQKQPDTIKNVGRSGGKESTANHGSDTPADNGEPQKVENQGYESSTPIIQN